jgi:hypothetical protein
MKKQKYNNINSTKDNTHGLSFFASANTQHNRNSLGILSRETLVVVSELPEAKKLIDAAGLGFEVAFHKSLYDYININKAQILDAVMGQLVQLLCKSKSGLFYAMLPHRVIIQTGTDDRIGVEKTTFEAVEIYAFRARFNDRDEHFVFSLSNQNQSIAA